MKRRQFLWCVCDQYTSVQFTYKLTHGHTAAPFTRTDSLTHSLTPRLMWMIFVVMSTAYRHPPGKKRVSINRHTVQQQQQQSLWNSRTHKPIDWIQTKKKMRFKRTASEITFNVFADMFSLWRFCCFCVMTMAMCKRRHRNPCVCVCDGFVVVVVVVVSQQNSQTSLRRAPLNAGYLIYSVSRLCRINIFIFLWIRIRLHHPLKCHNPVD